MPKNASSYWLDSKAFSFASYGSEDAKILVKREGEFTRKLIENAESGFTASVRYPFGDILLNSNSNKIMIAGGTGISIFLSYIDYLNLSDFRTINFIFHSMRSDEINLSNYYWNKIPENLQYKKFVTSKDNAEYTGRLSYDSILSSIRELDNFEFYVCGPTSFNDYWIEALLEHGYNCRVEQWINSKVI
ncbi:flavohemoprotein [mine drainage metagenome]|uniref:Flavohemoprotein n=1 Tax=mine drainage metagenome TaxID=410659 RepID=T1D788_9ZZZZ